MKRKISLAFMVLSLFVVLLAFVSCGDHEHSYGGWETDGTNHWKCCTVDGCEEMGEKAVHKLKTESSQRADCEKSGETVEVCEVCSYKKTTELDALGHDLEEKIVNKTCEKDGYTEIKCNRTGCKYSEKKDIVPKGHELEETFVDPTCITSGKKISTCTALLCNYIEEEEIPALGHDEVKKVVPATCTSEGYTNVTCSRCKFAETRDVTAIIPHSYKEQTVLPTCTEEGYTASVCSVCGDETNKTNIKAALNHDLKPGTAVEPSCEEEGYTPNECSRCDYVEKIDIVAARGHQEIFGEPVAATCRKAGYTPVTCSVCDYAEHKEIVEALGHVYYFEEDAKVGVHYKVDYEPTCDTDGQRSYRCTRCNEYPIDDIGNKKPIPALGHQEEYEVVPPTCTLKGYTIVTCKVCDYEETRDKVSETGHTYFMGEGEVLGTHYEVTLAPTCTEKGEKSYYCQTEGCKALATEDTSGKGEIPSIGHNWQISHEPWCGNDGVTEFYCNNVCREVPCTETKTEDATEEYRHTFDDERVLIAQTCVDYATYECPVCDKNFVAYEGAEYGQPTGIHEYSGYSNTVMPTCTEKGYTVYYCMAGNCGLTENRDYTDTIAHTLGTVLENGTVSCQICNKSYMDVTAENVKGGDALCICGQDPCICEGTSADWEGFAKPKEPYAIVAEEEFVITEVVWSEQTNPLAIGYGLIVLNGQDETSYTVVIYAEDGSEALHTFAVTGSSVMIDLYEYGTVGKVVITATTDAAASFYASI